MTSKNLPTRIAVDAMGGDHAPCEVVKGAVEYARSGQVEIMLIGDPTLVTLELEKYEITDLPISVIPSEGVIQENDSPALAIRQNPKASIIVSTGLVKEGQAHASVTMGSTGGAMAAAALILGLAKGIERPALGGPIMGMAPKTVIVDLGTNVDCRPQQLVSFAVMGDVFAKQSWNFEYQRIALLSVGSEVGKGNRQVKETTEILEESGLNFIGNIEAHDLLNDAAEVVVCDGFVGNIVMKLTEGIGSYMADLVLAELAGKVNETDLENISKKIFELSNQVATHGGGPLFGVNGISVVGHGAARSEAVERAIGMAKMAVDTGFVSQMYKDLESLHTRLEK